MNPGEFENLALRSVVVRVATGQEGSSGRKTEINLYTGIVDQEDLPTFVEAHYICHEPLRNPEEIQFDLENLPTDEQRRAIWLGTTMKLWEEHIPPWTYPTTVVTVEKGITDWVSIDDRSIWMILHWSRMQGLLASQQAEVEKVLFRRLSTFIAQATKEWESRLRVS